jgi:hypothetical protein
MTTIRATCPTCGEVGLTPDEIDLRVDPGGATASFYAFNCPTCCVIVRKPADERIVRLLASGGVEVRQLISPSSRHGGPPLTHDDLIDFHTLLRTDHWFDELVALVRG